MNKKLIIKITIGLFLLYCIYQASTSANFLVPIDVKDSEIQEVFRPEIVRDLKTVYSFGNFKNHVSFHDINGQIRCRLIRFNEYKNLPKYIETEKLDSIRIKNDIRNYFGHDPKLIVFNHQFKSYAENPILIFDKKSKDLSFHETDSFIEIYGNIKSFGLFDENKECEIKFQFSSLNVARLLFFKKMNNYYIAYVYGIDGYKLKKDDRIIQIN